LERGRLKETEGEEKNSKIFKANIKRIDMYKDEKDIENSYGKI